MHVNYKLFLFSPLFALLACSSNPAQEEHSLVEDKSIVIIDRPVIKSYKDASATLKQLKHSIVRVKTKKDTAETISTGFFYKTPDMLVTALHSFDKDHACRKQEQCELILGLVEDNKPLEEHTLMASMVFQEPERDLIYFKIEKARELMKIVPLQDAESNDRDGALSVGGFYHDNPEMTFTMGKHLYDAKFKNLTTIIVSQGFSGSPVLNAKGRVVGVVSNFRPIKNHHIGLAQYATLAIR
ncbi:MAG: trypsin-like peptidase domain-containing protein [Bdellovibrionaceae bacterium]|nr:trypsin-like peptidase domain-containing protein [Pseudobdellovibrionaceae bacterium]